MDDEQEGMDKTSADPYPQDLEDLRKSLKKPYNRSVVRRSTTSAIAKAIVPGWILQAEAANYPAFVMGDQFVVFFAKDSVVKQVSGPAVKYYRR